MSAPFRQGDRKVLQFANIGAFTEQTVVKARQAVPINKDVPFEVASLLGCGVITGVGAVFNRAKVTHGQSVLVIGVGGIGLNVIQGAALADALPIIAIDTNPKKEALARQFGATHFINAAEVDTHRGGQGDLPERRRRLVRVRRPPGADPPRRSTLLDWGGTCVILGVPKFGTEASFLVSEHVQRQDDHGLPLRRRSTPQGHPAVRRPVPRRPAQARRAGHQDLPLDDIQQTIDDMHNGDLARGVLQIGCSAMAASRRAAGAGREGLATGVAGATTTSGAPQNLIDAAAAAPRRSPRCGTGRHRLAGHPARPDAARRRVARPAASPRCARCSSINQTYTGEDGDACVQRRHRRHGHVGRHPHRRARPRHLRRLHVQRLPRLDGRRPTAGSRAAAPTRSARS